MLRRVALVRTDVSEELGASFIRVTRIGELETTLAATSNRRMLAAEDTFLHSHRRENLKSYMVMNLWVSVSVGKFLNSWTTGCFSSRAQLHGARLTPKGLSYEDSGNNDAIVSITQ
jgi:hypothetical protein